jgi:hypothetical protein
MKRTGYFEARRFNMELVVSVGGFTGSLGEGEGLSAARMAVRGRLGFGL